MSHRLPRVLVLAPAGLDGSERVAAAASRAGGLGILSDPHRDRLARVARLTDRSFAARVGRSASFDGWLGGSAHSLAAVIGEEDGGHGWQSFARRVHTLGRLALAEVTSRESARDAIASGIDGLIASGDEAGGRVGQASTFILTQDLLALGRVPVWSRGGIGPDGAAGCVAMGAAGVVLDGATLLGRESPLAESRKARIARLDGGETIVIGPAKGPRFRILVAPGSPAVAALRDAADAGGPAWDAAALRWIGWGPEQAWPVGQDGAMADRMARTFVTVGGIIGEVERAIDANIRSARTARPMLEGSPMAEAHGTRLPIVQGPMTRVSDSSAFAASVSEGGALPMLALAMLRGPEVRELLRDTHERLRDRSWGVGLLGFVAPELRKEQLAEVLRARPRFALIAGGRPDQARELEAAGIATYLHAPSPGLLRQYLKDGARRFVFEGRECGGHVGPRSSLVLWQQAADVLIEAIDGGVIAEDLHLLFAGGVHDARSSAFVAAMTARLADRGARVGVLIGTAYLFTEEAVSSGAIVPRFQAEAVGCDRTVLLETGPGHEVRVGPSPFVVTFESNRGRLLDEGRPLEAIRDELEALNAGRLRLAAKGVERQNGVGSPILPVPEPAQHDRGLYMLGQAATLRSEVTTIDALHREISEGAAALLGESTEADDPEPARPSDVAIVGLSAIFPGAADARTFWENTLRGLDAIGEIPPDRWDWRPYYDADPKAPDKVISKWGGFVPDVAFDPLRYGMPPNSLRSIEPVQLLTLEAVRAALEDAGYADRPFARERTSVVLGIGGGSAQLAMGYAFRSYLPMLDAVDPGAGDRAMQACEGLLPEWTEDAFPGFLLNVAAGRVANRFDLGGSNYAVDAACGSSLAAAHLAVRELEVGAADVVILGGADTVQNPLTYLAFSKTQAFSPRGRCRPFDDSADGIVISEGVAAIVLKRLADAERDGDRIYAVIKGMGSSSDGRARGLTAPRPEGQVRALQRAYAKAGVDPATIGYVEAHGTGTAVGDVVEASALAQVLHEAGARDGACAIGSVKSSIGHTKCAAGMAGLINAALALHHKVLPPTIGVDTPNPRAGFGSGPLHVSATLRPWIHGESDRPRRAGVSAFGFGGTNFHAVLEAYESNLIRPQAPAREWPSELFVWGGPDRDHFVLLLERLATDLGETSATLRDLSHAFLSAFTAGDAGPVLSIVAESVADLRGKLAKSIAAIHAGESTIADPRGIFFRADPPFRGSPLAFVFPGQGSQSPGMMVDLAIGFAEVREAIEEADRALTSRGGPPIGAKIYPPRAFTEDEAASQKRALTSPIASQPAVGAASVGLMRLLGSLGLKPDVVAGHSYGEFVALHAAGAFQASVLAEVSEARGRFLMEAQGDRPGSMAALLLGPERTREVLNGWTDVMAVNFNGPGQTVIAGSNDGVARAVASARDLGHRAKELPVACAFHTDLVSGAVGPLTRLLQERIADSPRIPVYANLDAAVHPADPLAIADRMGRHAASPVKFAPMIERMHADGARVFVECGPGGVLAPLVDAILGDRPHLSVSLDAPGRPGVPTLLIGLAQLLAHGVRLRPERLTGDRFDKVIDLSTLPRAADNALPPSTWLVNGSRARPLHEPETRRLGQAGLSPTKSPERPHAPAEMPSPAAPSAATSQALAPSPREDRVILAFQDTMRQFLDVQRSTMQAYLAGGARPARPVIAAPPSSTPAAPTIACPTQPSPPEPRPQPLVKVEEPAKVEARRDRDSIAACLVRIVRDRTGYPPEMLRLDLDLEADLGIDSIKRVEILGSLRDAFAGLAPSLDSGAMDDLARSRTLGAIVDRFARALAKAEAPEAPRVRRMVLDPVSVPLPQGRAGFVPGGVFLVTDDGRGVARAVASALLDEGHPAVLVDLDEGGAMTPESIRSTMEEARALGPLAGIVHASPLRMATTAGGESSRWADRPTPEVRGLFLLAREAAEELEAAARLGGACLISASALGGSFGSVGTNSDRFDPVSGGVVGLAKTLAREWPSVSVRAVDLDPDDETGLLADRLVAEIFAEETRSEIGYGPGRRLALVTRDAPLIASEASLTLPAGAPVIITGGARGITAAVAEELARRWRPRLLIVGTTREPSGAEDRVTAEIDDAATLKSVLLEAARARGERPSPSDLDAEYRSLMRAREVRRNLAAIRRAGSEVDYASVDVRDGDALARVIGGWTGRYGPPAGLVHGAGVIHDKLLRDKTPESFDRVFGTKVEGAWNLLRALDLDALRFAALFSSIAGRFGNRGQSDYAAANEALNKLALWLDRRMPGRVLSAIWGPWSGVGMVSDLEGHLGRQGLGMIPPREGASKFVDELARGRKGEVEVLLAGALGTLELPPGSFPPSRVVEEAAR